MSASVGKKQKAKTLGFFDRLFGRRSSQQRDGNASMTVENASPRVRYKLPGSTSTSYGHNATELGKYRASISRSTPSNPDPDRQVPSSSARYNVGNTRTRSEPTRSISIDSTKMSSKSRRRTRRRCVSSSSSATTVDGSRGFVEYPATPETMLAHHYARPFLDDEELEVLEQLDEFECLVDGEDVIRAAAHHVRYFGVDPTQLWEEFFHYVDDMAGYDEVISAEVWREFTDRKYPC